ncbi:PREDICTED: leukosialin [Condylura cristata]|uniref:leukosialin n=1 Tax=Condylura cristata TaxID=143302 RepID=UPI00064395AC|nr:PREDICTED: leukosialin [Condylura cristata]
MAKRSHCSWSPLLCPGAAGLLLGPLVMEVTLLLLLSLGSWAQGPSAFPETLQPTSTLNGSSDSLVSEKSETSNLNSVTSSFALTRGSEDKDSLRSQVTRNPPPSTLNTGADKASPGTSTDVDVSASVSTTPQEISTKSIAVLEISEPTNNTAVSIATDSLDLHTVTAKATVTTSLEPTHGTSGSPTVKTTSSLEPTNGASSPPVTMATSSPDTSSGISGPLVTMATSSLDTSNGTSGSLVTVTASFEVSSTGITGSPTSWVKMSPVTPSKTSSNISSKSTPKTKPDLRAKSTLFLLLFMALVVIALVVLLKLWRWRQQRRTGAVTLHRVGKRNGVVDAWAGPVSMPEEEAGSASAGVAGGDQSSGEPVEEGPVRRPTLTTFFGRRKSRQGSLVLEELKAGSAPGLKGEVEPLVDSEEEAEEGTV